MTFSHEYLEEVEEIAETLDCVAIEKMVEILSETKKSGGRLFILGVGGSAANASHAVNDFRKICNMEAYAPTDNVAELTARINDYGWETCFAGWLQASHVGNKDAVLVLSVSGGNKNTSVNIIRALEWVQVSGSKIIGIVGRDGGYTEKVADACVIIPTVTEKHITPHAESFQAVVWHLIVNHPKLQ